MKTLTEPAMFHLWAARRFIWALVLLAWSGASAWALDSMIGIHDPSTMAVCDGKYSMGFSGLK